MQISPTELAGKLAGDDPPRLLDVREPEEHAFATLPGAQLIPLGQLEARIEELTPWQADDFVVFCHHGMRSARAVRFLRSIGFTGATNLAGGIDRWSIEIDPSIPRY
jgi:rhodanese-related sulfurtransferase